MMQLELPTERPTQKRRVLALLRANGAAGVCIATVPLDVAYTLRNRISELRAEGKVIEGETCHVHHHRHRSAVLRYTLTGERDG